MADQQLPLITVTDLGRQRLLEATAQGKKLLISKIVFSSEFAALTPGRTKLTKPEEEFAVTAVAVKAKERLYIEALPIPARSYPVFEAGVFLADGSLFCIVGGEDKILFAIPGQKLPLSFEITVAQMGADQIQIVEAETPPNLPITPELAQMVKLLADAKAQALKTERELKTSMSDMADRLRQIEEKIGRTG